MNLSTLVKLLETELREKGDNEVLFVIGAGIRNIEEQVKHLERIETKEVFHVVGNEDRETCLIRLGGR